MGTNFKFNDLRPVGDRTGNKESCGRRPLLDATRTETRLKIHCPSVIIEEVAGKDPPRCTSFGMDDRIYDTSLTLYTVSDSSLPYRNLLQASQDALNAKATRLREHLSVRPKYEDEEEKEKIGGLRDCTWTAYYEPGHRRKDADEIVVVLSYDQAIYKFILYSNANNVRPGSKVDLPLLLVKASATVTKRFLSFLSETFHVTVNPLKLPSDFLAANISTYVSTLYSSFQPVSDTTSMLGLLKDTIGTLKLCISANPGSANGADVAQQLRTMDIDVPAETLYQLLTSPPPQASARGSKHYDFLLSLQHHIHQRTGLILPLLPKDGGNDTNEPPLKLSRVSNTSFALSTEGRLKLSSKAYEALETVPGLDRGDENVVKKANTQLLEAIVAEALKSE